MNNSETEPLKQQVKPSWWSGVVRNPRLRAGIAIVFVLVLVSQSFYLGWSLGSAEGQLPLAREIKNISTIIQDKALKPSTADEIRIGAFEGAIGSLHDDYAQYYPPEEYRAMLAELNSSFVGIGVVVKINEENLVVTSVIKDSPAYKAGVEAQDIIIGVDGEKPDPKQPGEIIQRIRGEEGTKVKVEVRRGDETKTFTIERAKLTQALVFPELINKDVGHIVINEFTRGVSAEFTKAVNQLYKEGAKSFIIDLRGNPGGLLESAQNMVSLFLPKDKKIISIETKDNVEDLKTIKGKADFSQLPFVVLVDSFSASSSEVFTSTIQDYGIAPIVGLQTYGKGVVQQILNLPNDAGMKLTTAEYKSSKGAKIDKVGIHPDVITAGKPKKQLDLAVSIAKGMVDSKGKKVAFDLKAWRKANPWYQGVDGYSESDAERIYHGLEPEEKGVKWDASKGVLIQGTKHKDDEKSHADAESDSKSDKGEGKADSKSESKTHKGDKPGKGDDTETKSDHHDGDDK